MSTGPSAEALLSVSDLSLMRGGRQLFTQLSFEIEPGQLVQIGGENGAGKTSLLRVLAGISRYGYEGEVRSCGVPILEDAAAYHNRLLFLGHQPAVKHLLTPMENLRWNASGEALLDDVAVEAALARVGLAGYEDVPSHSLSAGQHRRVNLARLFLSQRPLWLLDEPFTAIDKRGVAELEARLAAHVANGGAVVLTSHQPLGTDCPVLMLDLKTGVLS